jgi:hypothetical protein
MNSPAVSGAKGVMLRRVKKSKKEKGKGKKKKKNTVKRR